MPKKRLPKIDAWSFSRWSDYDRCPFLAKCKYILKLGKFDNAAMRRGKQIHKEAEDYVKAKLPALPMSLDRFEDEFEEARAFRAEWPDWTGCEESWAYTKQWEPTEYYGDETWLRMKLDLWQIPEEGVLNIIDHKSGKIRPGYEPQLELYACAGFAQFPEIEIIYTDLWYIDQGEIVGAHAEEPDPAGIYNRNQFEALKAKWNQRTRRMLNDTRFDPNPNRLCEWCEFSADKGGPCKY